MGYDTEPGVRALTLAVALAVGAALAAWLDHAALSIFAGLIALPVGLYASLAVRRAVLVVVALATAFFGVAVIGLWIYEFVTFPWGR